MDNWKEVVGALLGILIAVVWLAFAMIGFHVFFAIALTLVLSVLAGGFYGISAKVSSKMVLQFSLPINIWFIIMLCLFGIPFTYAWWNFVATMIQKRKTRYSVSEVEAKIQQVLADNRGESLSFVSLLHKVKFPGSLGEFKAIIKRLLEENIIKQTGSDDYPIYKAI